MRTNLNISKKTRDKLSQSLKTYWSNPENKARQIKAMLLPLRIHPNKPEMMLLSLLNQEDASNWKFVGDGELIIVGKNPDFWNGNHKLAELFGDYWHKGQNPQERIDLFQKEGYNTLIIWESELKYPNKVITKIKEFCK